MLKRLFIRKSKEILNQVESAEQVIKSAQESIDKLKKDDRFSLLREEILRLIYHSPHFSYQYQMRMAQRFTGISHSDYSDVIKQINECLDEMEGLIKEKDNASSERKEGQ
jgi:hypothetical protein